jgi:hypothetical protein
MTKEIHEQPEAVRATLLDHLDKKGHITFDEMRLSDDALRAITKVTLVGCGSSYHTAMVAKYAIEAWARISVEVDIASEFRYRNPVVDSSTLVIGVSQSGETIDTIQALREAKSRGAIVVAVSNGGADLVLVEDDGEGMEESDLLLAVEKFNGGIWEPACGDGSISKELEAAGYAVHSTDLIDRGYGTGGVDFLLDYRTSADNIVTNPPFKFAEEFVRLMNGSSGRER